MPAGTYSGGPYELRLPIFLQPLGGALKNRSAAPASPPCFRRRRTGCGTQHPLRLACVSLAAAPTTPRCFRRWRRSSSLQSAPLLFESTLESETSVFYKTKSPAYFHTLSIFGGRGWITQAALLKTARWAVFALSSATAPQLFESTLGYALKSFGQKKNSSIFTTLEFLVGAGGFEPPKLKSSRFTVCPHWPLGNTPIFFSCPLPDDLLSLS